LGEFCRDFPEDDAPEHAEASVTIESKGNAEERRKRVTETLSYTPSETTMHIRSGLFRRIFARCNQFALKRIAAMG
jgi:hypothetical protein